VLQELTGLTLNDKLIVAISSITKMFVGELIETGEEGSNRCCSCAADRMCLLFQSQVKHLASEDIIAAVMGYGHDGYVLSCSNVSAACEIAARQGR
jgi:hypothetical protein